MVFPTANPTTLQDLQLSTAAIVTRAQAAEVLGVDPRTVSAAIAQGTIPAIRLGRRLVIPKQAFINLLTATPDQKAIPELTPRR